LMGMLYFQHESIHVRFVMPHELMIGKQPLFLLM
jgi:hypothetical protein